MSPDPITPADTFFDAFMDAQWLGYDRVTSLILAQNAVAIRNLSAQLSVVSS
jgi:hypothetical protein